MQRTSVWLGTFAAGLAVAGATAQPVTTPQEHLGRMPGVDFELADWDEVRGYFERLADESPRVATRSLGRTTEGREFLLSIISDEANLADLERLRGYAQTIADPRGRSENERREAIEQGKVFLFISCAMHATETAAPQFAMEFAHRLATSDEEPWASARENVVVGLFPCLNPDGLDHVVSWYRRTVGTPFEASELLKLYQYYSGHDNNRDWFMLTQAETRLVTEQLYSVWFPQVYWDVHQQGSSAERLFVPPFRDPLNPNLDPAIIGGIDVLGSRALLDLTREGFTGVSTGVSYDMWWNGGNRNVPVRHNIIGLLTEAASVRIATPVFLPVDRLRAPRGLGEYAPSNRFPDPWPGGWWRLRDIIDYELAFGRSLLGSLAREREAWLANALEAAERVIEKGTERAPRAWLIPADNRDPAAVRRLLEILLQSGIEVHQSAAALTVDGRDYPAGTLVIRRDQPYGSHVKDLFEVQRYPGGIDSPYDIAGWTLPLLLGVRRVEVMRVPEGIELGRVRDVESLQDFAGDPRLNEAPAGSLSLHHSDAWTVAAARLGRGNELTLLAAGNRAGLLVPGVVSGGEEEPVALNQLPRVGVYSPWRGSMDEGWTRYVLDTFGVPYVTVRNEMLRAGALGDFLDVLVIPSLSGRQLDQGRRPGTVHDEYTRGLAPEGAVAVEEFVREGGTLVTFASSCRWAIELLRLGLVDVSTGEEAGDFSCPGSVLRGVPEPDGPFTAGLPSSVTLFFSRGCGAWRPMTEKERKEAKIPDGQVMEVLLRYAPTRVLLSGWIREPEVIAGHSGWVRAEYGAGHVHLLGFRPQFRGWTQATFPLIFRAIFLDGQGDR
ncbi:MAG: M14 family metallopeptidase [Planctomycetota bacterium]|jgi:hypothetical protein